jgi:CheY-like chemotaxis protein
LTAARWLEDAGREFNVRSMQAPQESPHILLVDDADLNLELISGYLQGFDLELETASNGTEAFEAIDRRQPDLVLLDVMMPGLDGFEICRRLKKQESTREVPVVLLTALDDESYRKRAEEAGADQFMAKPIHRDQLLATMRTLLYPES